MKKLVSLTLALMILLGAFAACPVISAGAASKKTMIGASYYFIWYKTKNQWWNYSNEQLASMKPKQNSSQEARSLSDPKYYNRVPFFGDVNNAGYVEFPEFTRDVWRKDMEYAIYCGIDYMAYFATSANNLKGQAAEYHASDPEIGAKIKMCYILMTRNELVEPIAEAMTKDWYFCINGRPVVYIYHYLEFSGYKDKMAELNALCKQKGLPDPYYISMEFANSDAQAQSLQYGSEFDAGTMYSYSCNRPGETFESLSERTKKAVVAMATNNNKPTVPLIILGRNQQPRIDYPVTWISSNPPYGGTYSINPTPAEITKTTLYMLNYNKRQKFSTNSVLFYAWNELTEGGWICPTLACDEQGNVLREEDGTPKIDTTHLEAVKRAIDAYRAVEDDPYATAKVEFSPEELATPTPKPTKAPAETPAPEAEPTDNGGTTRIIIIAAIAAAVCVLGAVGTVIGFKLGKKKNGQK